jgi:hypothetical protein
MNFFVRIWHRIVGEPTAADAIKLFNKSLKKLERACEFQSAKAVAAMEAAKLAEIAAEEAHNAAKHAERIKSRLNAITE